MRRLMGFAAMLLLAACGGGSDAITGPEAVGPGGYYTLSGIVTESTESGLQPSAGAWVSVASDESLRVRTDKDGRFAVAGLAAGRFSVTVSKAGYAAQSLVITISSDTSLLFQLEGELRRERNPR